MNNAQKYIDKIMETEILPLLKRYILANPTGGSLHIVLDDGNRDKESIRFCQIYATDNNDQDGWLLADYLLAMTKSQQAKIYEAYPKYTEEAFEYPANKIEWRMDNAT